MGTNHSLAQSLVEFLRRFERAFYTWSIVSILPEAQTCHEIAPEILGIYYSDFSPPNKPRHID